jgi:hypothetical protein
MMLVELGTENVNTHGNLYNEPLNVLRRKIGKFSIIHISQDAAGLLLGTVKHIATGKSFDFWFCADKTLCVQEAE